MWKRQLQRWTILVLFLALARHTPRFVEQFYASGLYRVIRNIDLFFLRWIPFSVGDLLYLFFPLWWLRELRRNYLKNRSWKTFALLASEWSRKIIFWFYLLWGLNYFRLPLYRQWHMNLQPVSLNRLDTLARREIDSLNRIHSRFQGVDTAGFHIPYDLDKMWGIAAEIYRKNEKFFPRFAESFYVVKPSLLSRPVSYLGVVGYLNPFTHESQVNTRYPKVFLPHVMLHELAHQIGYAYENEAEFIGFIEGIHSDDPYFRYSAHLVALEYLLSEVRKADSTRFEMLKKQLRPGILTDYRKQKEFLRRYRLPFDASKPYDLYLKVNQQGHGISSYDEMVLYLSAYLP